MIVRFYLVSFYRMMHVDSEMAHASIILPPNRAQKTKLFCNLEERFQFTHKQTNK